ncbi:MAG: PepSY-associated TM helix domain-containing protein, partial [Bacteroidota bacterium]
MNGKKEKKDKSRRLYNVFFNTHTVSGIIISMGLYVIFLAGAFALYQNHINNWEINAPEAYFTPDLDYDRILEEVAKEGYQTYGRDITINLTSNSGRYISVFSGRPANKISNDSLNKLSKEDSIAYTKATARFDYILEPGTYKLTTPADTNDADKRIGRLLTKLHYFQQIPVVGLFLSGFVSIFFLFSMVSGVIIHWKKIISNFFTFRLKSTIKNLWKDAHTALGILGIPFQLMYALTGTAFGLGIVVFPIAMVFYGNVNKSTEVLLPERAKYKLMGESPNVAINPLVQDAMVDIPEKDIENWRVMVKAFGDKNAHLDVVVHTESKEDFSGKATATYKL